LSGSSALGWTDLRSDAFHGRWLRPRRDKHLEFFCAFDGNNVFGILYDADQAVITCRVWCKVRMGRNRSDCDRLSSI
jgi:hypothetical protein